MSGFNGRVGVASTGGLTKPRNERSGEWFPRMLAFKTVSFGGSRMLMLQVFLGPG